MILTNQPLMTKNTRILFATDFSDTADQALRYAVYLAKTFSAKLYLCHIIEYKVSSFLKEEPDFDALHGLVRNRIQKSFDKHGLENDDFELIIRVSSSPANALMKIIAEKNINFIIIGSHGERTQGWRILGSNAQEITRVANYPVLGIRNYHTPHVRLPPQRILVPMDLSDENKKAAELATVIAKKSGSIVDLLHVQEDNHPYVPEEEIKERMVGMFGDAAGSLQLETHVEEGYAPTEIIEFSYMNDTDLLISTSHGETANKRFFIGNVADKIIRFSRSSVLLVQSFETVVKYPYDA